MVILLAEYQYKNGFGNLELNMVAYLTEIMSEYSQMSDYGSKVSHGYQLQ